MKFNSLNDEKDFYKANYIKLLVEIEELKIYLDTLYKESNGIFGKENKNPRLLKMS